MEKCRHADVPWMIHSLQFALPVALALGCWACGKSQGCAPSAAASEDWPWSSVSSDRGWTSCSAPADSPWSEKAFLGWTWAAAASAAAAPWSWPSPCPVRLGWPGPRSHLEKGTVWHIKLLARVDLTSRLRQLLTQYVGRLCGWCCRAVGACCRRGVGAGTRGGATSRLSGGWAGGGGATAISWPAEIIWIRKEMSTSRSLCVWKLGKNNKRKAKCKQNDIVTCWDVILQRRFN